MNSANHQPLDPEILECVKLNLKMRIDELLDILE